MRMILAAAALLGLAACTHTPTLQEITASADATCNEYGFTVGHPEYGTCRLQVVELYMEERRTAAAERQADASWTYATSTALGNAALALQPITAPPAPQQNLNCRSQRLFNGDVKTTCY